MTIDNHQRVGLIAAVLVVPSLAVVVLHYKLHLAAAVLAAFWLVAVGMAVREAWRPGDGHVEAVVPILGPTPPPSTVDPTMALLEALGDGVTGGQR